MADPAREQELDAYEARFGKYVEEQGRFGIMSLKVGVQSFPIFWKDDDQATAEVNAADRRWFKRALCCALNELVKAETVDHTKEQG